MVISEATPIGDFILGDGHAFEEAPEPPVDVSTWPAEHAPESACATWHACYAALEAFERDLQQHVHLENNVLFPAAMRLEQSRPAPVAG